MVIWRDQETPDKDDVSRYNEVTYVHVTMCKQVILNRYTIPHNCTRTETVQWSNKDSIIAQKSSSAVFSYTVAAIIS